MDIGGYVDNRPTRNSTTPGLLFVAILAAASFAGACSDSGVTTAVSPPRN